MSEGQWLLIEDINLAPQDVLASLVGLLERRQLYLPQQAQSIAAHPGFQLIASVTSSPGRLQLCRLQFELCSFQSLWPKLAPINKSWHCRSSFHVAASS